jgi:MraZ protein
MGVTTFVITRWFDGCLAGFDPKGWQRLLGRLQTLDGGQKQARQLIRSVAGRAVEARIDRQGRVLIPRKLLDRAGITDRATISGVGDRIEFWNPERYADYIDEADQELEKNAQEIDVL